jgi:Undecaprenyl-phosphate glucose phosphotransferase
VGETAADLYIVPDVWELATLNAAVGEFEGMPILSLRASRVSGWGRILKRAMDIVVSAVVLVALSPVLLVTALAVKLTSRGPVIYKQERMGLDGRVFNTLKFRTMRVDAEAETGPRWASEGDTRTTFVGRILRRTSLDELPQFWNVLKGDMSIVGPRPERPVFIEEFKRTVPKYMLRHKMKAGITGWAQVNGWRGSTSLDKRIQYDLYYIENWSIWLDLRIMLATIPAVVTGRNAY